MKIEFILNMHDHKVDCEDMGLKCQLFRPFQLTLGRDDDEHAKPGQMHTRAKKAQLVECAPPPTPLQQGTR